MSAFLLPSPYVELTSSRLSNAPNVLIRSYPSCVRRWQVSDVAEAASECLGADKTLFLTPGTDGVYQNGELMRWLTLPMAQHRTQLVSEGRAPGGRVGDTNSHKYGSGFTHQAVSEPRTRAWVGTARRRP